MSKPKPPPASDGLGALWRRSEVLKRVALCESAIDELERRDRFPRRVTLTARAVAWRDWEVLEWVRIGPDAWQQRMTDERTRSVA